MITENILEFFGNIVAGLISALPDFVLPNWVTVEVPNFWLSLFQDIYKLQKFVPVEAIFNVAIFIIIAQIAFIATKLGRMLLSNVTGGGGAL
jgi:hypothetical protein